MGSEMTAGAVHREFCLAVSVQVELARSDDEAQIPGGADTGQLLRRTLLCLFYIWHWQCWSWMSCDLRMWSLSRSGVVFVPGKAELRVVTDECGRRSLALVAVDADCVPVYQARQLHTTSLPASGSKAIVKGERECLSSAIRIFSMAQAGVGYEK